MVVRIAHRMPRRLIARPNDIEFSGERKRVRCNEGLGAPDER
jgi:hypothetical protein